MPRNAKPAAIRLLNGRGPGRDSGGRVVAPPRLVFRPPTMPPGLPTPVRRQWRRVIAELAELELPMPPAAVLADYCRCLVRQHEVAAALEDASIGSTDWRRLITTETELAKRIEAFHATWFVVVAAPVEVDTGYAAAEHNPFDPDSGPAPWPPPGMSPEYAAMQDRWGPPQFWRGRKLKTMGARDDARAVKAWEEFDPIYAPSNRFRRGNDDDAGE